MSTNVVRNTGSVSPSTLLLVDDHPLIVHALSNFFHANGDFDVIGTASNGMEAVAAYNGLHPDAVLMDLQMPVMDGVEATQRIVAGDPGAKVVILTTFASLDFVLPSLRAGASGFLVKDAHPEEILNALRVVLNEEESMPISPQVVKLLADEALGEGTAASHQGRADSPVDHLTAREKQLLNLLGQGMNNREIAAAMGVSEGSAKAYLGRVCDKLEVRDRLQALIRAFELGLVSPGLSGDRL